MNTDGRLAGVKWLIRDRDTKFTATFDHVFTANGVRILKTPPQASRANAHAERWVGTVRRECLDRMLIAGEHHLRNILAAYVAHYNQHRPYRAFQQRPPESPAEVAHIESARIARRPILGGLVG
jgi:putative transposase